MELLDNDQLDSPENEFQVLKKLGYNFEKKETERVWTGRSNIYYEKHILLEFDEKTEIYQTINLLDKKSESGNIIMRTAEIELRFPYQLENCSIETKRSFNWFKSSVNLTKLLYKFNGLDQTKLLSLFHNQLLSFQKVYVKIRTISNNCNVTLIDENNQICAKDLVDFIEGVKIQFTKK